MEHQHLTVSIAKTILTFLPICWFAFALLQFHQIKRPWALVLAFVGHARLLLWHRVFTCLVSCTGAEAGLYSLTFLKFWFLLLSCLGRRRILVLSLFPLLIHPCLLWTHCCFHFCEKNVPETLSWSHCKPTRKLMTSRSFTKKKIINQRLDRNCLK